MKKLFALLALVFLAVTVNAGNYTFDSLINGYNLNIPPSTTSAGGGTTNILYSYIHGEIYYSLTNNVTIYTSSGALATNQVAAPDAFGVAIIHADANSDLNANACVVASIGNTNLIPVAVTNVFGQWYVTNWPLGSPTYQTYQYPATTNVYPAYSAANVNTLTISLYRSVIPPSSGNAVYGMTDPKAFWETTPSFTFTVLATGVTPVTVITNLPIGFMQGGRYVKATISSTGTGGATLLNQLGIGQYVP